MVYLSLILYTKMKRAERKNIVRANETNRKIKTLANAYGYEAGECYITTYGKPEICVRPKDRTHRSFTPDLYMRGHWNGSSME